MQHGDDSSAEPNRIPTSAFMWFAIVLLCAIVSSIFVVRDYYRTFHDLAADPATWGQFGDYVGGILNPLFGLITAFGLLGTLAFQIHELRLTAKEISDSSKTAAEQSRLNYTQSFESSFFQLLKLHNDIINAIELTLDGRLYKGRACFAAWVHKFHIEVRQEAAIEGRPIDFLRRYETFYISRQHTLGHYFRLLYNIIKFVKRAEEIDDKKFYVNLVRAQLSSDELVLILYNCLSKWGIQKFKPLIEEFALLKTVPKENILEPLLIRMYSKDAFGGSYPDEPPLAASETQ